MSTTTVRKQVQKLYDQIVSPKQDGPITYFIDQYQLAQHQREINPALSSGNTLLTALKRFYSAETIIEFFAAMENPIEFYNTKHRIKHEDEFSKYATLGIDFNIVLPAGYDDVITAAKKATRHFEGKRREYFEVNKGELELTEAYYNKRNRKCYQVAETAEEKERLIFCLGVIESIQKIEPILARDPKNKTAIEKKLYALPCPYFCKIVDTPNGAELIPSPAFISEGFAGTAHLGRYIYTKRELKYEQKDNAPKLGKKMKKLQIMDASGFPTGDYVLCEEKDLEKHAFGPFRVHRNIVLDGWYNEQGRPYGEPLKPDNILNPTSYTEKVINSLIEK